jgi:hypothetical protein
VNRSVSRLRRPGDFGVEVVPASRSRLYIQGIQVRSTSYLVNSGFGRGRKKEGEKQAIENQCALAFDSEML